MEILIKSNLKFPVTMTEGHWCTNDSSQYRNAQCLSSGLFIGGGKSVDIKQQWSPDYHDMMVCLRLEITLTAKYKYAFVTSQDGEETKRHKISHKYIQIFIEHIKMI